MTAIRDLTVRANRARFIQRDLELETTYRNAMETLYGTITSVNQFHTQENLVMYYSYGWGDAYPHATLAAVNPEIASFDGDGNYVVHDSALLAGLTGLSVEEVKRVYDAQPEYSDIELRVLSMIPKSLLDNYDGSNSEKIVQYVNDHIFRD